MLEDFPTLHEIKVHIKDVQAKEIRIRPSGEELAFENREDGVYFTLPKLRCHALLEILT